MGILEFISNEHAGIIPRALSQIFEYADQQYNLQYNHHHSQPQHQIVDEPIVVSLSFLQLYRETIQDLLAPALHNSSNNYSINNNYSGNYHNNNNNMNNSFISTNTISNNNNNNASSSSIVVDENLLIREDPYRGFFVEGLQEFIVRNYSEAGEIPYS